MRKLATGEWIADRYHLIRELGRGGAGIVFEAEHRFTGRHVALKMLGADHKPSMDAELSARLLREARALGSVQHPGIVEIFDAGTTPEGAPFIAMEMLHGRTLEGILAARTRLGADDTLAIGLQLASALGALHKRSVIHRDVKPGNLFVIRDGEGTARVKLMDLGIASSLEFKGQKLTAHGEIVGTVEYMSMERLAGDDAIDPRVDIYAAGVTLFECLAGDAPFTGSLGDIVRQVMPTDAEPVQLRVEGVPQKLAAAIERACARRREDRFATMEDFHAALVAAAEGRAIALSLLDDPQARQRAAGGSTPPAAMARRKFARAPYATPIRIATAAGSVDGRSEDISAGGMLVISSQQPVANEEVHVRFALPIEGTVATARALVRWARRGGDPKGPCAIGLEFIEPTPQIVTSIERFVEIMGRLT